MHGHAIARGDVLAPEAEHDPSRHVAPDCAGLNFFAIDRGLRGLLGLYLVPDTRAALEPHFQRMGELAGCSTRRTCPRRRPASSGAERA